MMNSESILEQTNLFYDKRMEIYNYISAENLVCYSCKNQLNELMILHHSFCKRRFLQEFYCLNCINKIQNGDFIDSYKICRILKKRKESDYPIFIFMPELAVNKGGFSIHQIEELQKNDPHSIIKYDSFAQKINQFDELEYKTNTLTFQEKNKQLNLKINNTIDFDNFLFSIKNSLKNSLLS